MITEGQDNYNHLSTEKEARRKDGAMHKMVVDDD
jgi:hypothetical protein